MYKRIEKKVSNAGQLNQVYIYIYINIYFRMSTPLHPPNKLHYVLIASNWMTHKFTT